ncbi:hypothetical protein FQR65_LT07486 [Abscondita terminalis]|nr:hypothetical protein FQR65_LT07486 [Abscondita terminalis]
MFPHIVRAIRHFQDEERHEQLMQYNLQRRIMRNNVDPFLLDDVHFINQFRLTKNMAHYLIEGLTPHMYVSQHPSAVEPQLRVFTTLYFFANGSYPRVIGSNFNLSMAQNTVSNCVTDANILSDEWIAFPITAEEKISIKETFMEKTNFPGVIGAIDCTHIAIIAPSQEEHNYVNRKCYHSKNIQVISNFVYI